MVNPILTLDVHFYVSVVGTECEKGNNSRGHLINELVKLTSLNEQKANQFLDAMIEAEKLVDDGNGCFRCTIPS